jgi:hypothetical protein
MGRYHEKTSVDSASASDDEWTLAKVVPMAVASEAMVRSQKLLFVVDSKITYAPEQT